MFEKYDYATHKTQLNKIIRGSSNGYYGNVLLECERNMNQAIPLIKTMIKKSTIKEHIGLIYFLTYHPSLIGQTLDLMVQEQKQIIPMTSQYPHPILCEFAHQIGYLYSREMIQDDRYNATRDAICNFLNALKQAAPDYFAQRNENGDKPSEMLRMYGEANLPQEVQTLIHLLEPLDPDVVLSQPFPQAIQSHGFYQLEFKP